MRHIGTLPEEAQARKFADYLLTQEVRLNVEPDGSEWAVWVFDEDQVPKAKEELASFRENPGAEKYAKAKAEADAIRQKEIRKHREVKKKVVRANETWNQSRMQRCPVTITLLVMSIAAVLATTPPNKPLEFGAKIEPGLTWLAFAPLFEEGGRIYSSRNTFEAIFRGEVWRIFTPMFLHFGPLHLLFNMMWLVDLGSSIEVRRGRWKFFGLVLLIAGVSNTAQAIWSGPYFGGMSGVVFGLFGYIWMQSRFVPTSDFFMPQNLVVLMLIYMAICYAGIIGNIANAAHTVGLVMGMLMGYAPKLWRDLTR